LCGSCFAQGNTSNSQSVQPGSTIRTIYQYKAELGLTDKQESNLKKILGDFQVYLTKKNKELAALQTKLNEMINKKEKLRKIRKHLERMARIQVDASYLDIKTARKVEKVLTPTQLAEWKAIQMDFQNKFQERVKAAQ
jgi:Spy/CpxP family protein refolding chaperone